MTFITCCPVRARFALLLLCCVASRSKSFIAVVISSIALGDNDVVVGNIAVAMAMMYVLWRSIVLMLVGFG